MAKLPEVNLKKFLPFIVIILVLAIVGGAVWYFKYYKSSASASSADVQAVVAQVSRLMELPTDETPTLATVSDPAQLASQPFFARAQIGDKVLIYVKAQRAILYRPSTNKIINVGPINITSPAPTESAGIRQGEEEANPQEQPQTQQVKIALYNGTTTSGLTTRFAADLSKKITNVDFSIVVKENANSQNYDKTQIIDLTGSNQDVVRSLALSFNGVSSKLPEGEVNPEDAQILVILGADYAASGQKPTTPPTETPLISQ